MRRFNTEGRIPRTKRETIMDWNPAPSSQAPILVELYLLLPLLVLIAAAALINGITRQKVVNGAVLYLMAAALYFGACAYMIVTNDEQRSITIRGHIGWTPVFIAGDKAELIGGLVGYFILPIVIAIYWSRRFRNG
jgi:hypothetical protein